MRLYIETEPMGAVRLTQGTVRMVAAGKMRGTPAERYLTYKEQIAWEIKAQAKELTKSACMVTVVFHMPIPQSWSNTKKMHASYGTIRHTVKPDIDNLVKGIFDAANGLIWKDDNQVVQVNAAKYYGKTPGISIEVEELF